MHLPFSASVTERNSDAYEYSPLKDERIQLLQSLCVANVDCWLLDDQLQRIRSNNSTITTNQVILYSICALMG